MNRVYVKWILIICVEHGFFFSLLILEKENIVGAVLDKACNLFRTRTAKGKLSEVQQAQVFVSLEDC